MQTVRRIPPTASNPAECRRIIPEEDAPTVYGVVYFFTRLLVLFFSFVSVALLVRAILELVCA